MINPNITKTNLNWCLDILKRIQTILIESDMSDEDKIKATAWLVKQALKADQTD